MNSSLSREDTMRSRKSLSKNVLEDKKTSLFSISFLQVKRSTKNNITVGILVVALFFERYCFFVTVYKTKYYGYLTILLVIFFNTIFNSIIAKIRENKHQRVFHELFNIERAPKISTCIISLLG